MTNTDIFNFEFVDRENERTCTNCFLDFTCKKEKYALWIHGKRGVGKSFFITNEICTNKNFLSIYVNPQKTVPNNYIKEFISELDKKAELKLTQYIRANYRSILKLGQKTVETALNITDCDDAGITDLVTSITNHFITHYNEQENVFYVIKKYIEKIIKKNQRVVFIFDNFSLCDIGSLDLILKIFHCFYELDNVKFIICTTEDDLNDREDIKNVLATKLPNKLLKFEPFKDKNIFFRMLEHCIAFDQENINLLSEAFEVCKGYPQQFKELLINLYTNEGMLINNMESKAYFVNEIFMKLIAQKMTSLDIDSLSMESKEILETISLWGAPIPTNLLCEYISYFFSEEPLCDFSREITIKAINELVDAQILVKTYKNNTHLLSFKHDSLAIITKKYFENSKALSFKHFNMYSFLKTIKETSYYIDEYHRYLLAYHAYKSRADKWIEINYNYLKFLYEKSLYYDAEIILLRLINDLNHFSVPQLLLFAQIEFNCGKYERAIDILKNIDKDNISNETKKELLLEYYLLLAKSNACLLRMTDALDAVSLAEKIPNLSEASEVLLLSRKMSILFLSPNGFKEAKALFDDLVSSKIESIEMIQVYISAMDYYEGAEALEYLNKGLDLTEQYNDTLTKGKFLNNIAFEKIRSSDYNVSTELYLESIQALKDSQTHELAYPYSNLSVIEMIKGNWEKALNYIVEATFWNKSSYADLVLKTNRMICYYFLKRPEWKHLYDDLYNYVKEYHKIDDKIYKKICINLAYVAIENNDLSAASKVLELYEPFSHNEWPQGLLRYNKMQSIVFGKQHFNTIQSPYIEYYFDIEFEPWLLNFTHD